MLALSMSTMGRAVSRASSPCRRTRGWRGLDNSGGEVPLMLTGRRDPRLSPGQVVTPGPDGARRRPRDRTGTGGAGRDLSGSSILSSAEWS